MGKAPHRYHLTYQITAHPKGITKEEVPPNHGACDAVILHSMIYPADGSFSQMTVGTDGREDRDPTPNEMFKAWSLFTKQLADNVDLSPNKRELCQVVFETICAAITGNKQPEDVPRIRDVPKATARKKGDGE